MFSLLRVLLNMEGHVWFEENYARTCLVKHRNLFS